MFGCIAPPRQSRNVMRSYSQDSREFPVEPKFRRPASVDVRERLQMPAHHQGLIRERSATPPPIPTHPPNQHHHNHNHHHQQTKPPKMKRLDKWIGNLLSDRGSTGRLPPSGGEHKNTNDWRYADDVKVRIAPLASSDLDGGDSRYGPPPTQTRAASVLQSLRDQKESLEYDENRRAVSTLPGSYHHPNVTTTSSSSGGRSEVYGTIQRYNDVVGRTDSILSRQSSDSLTAKHLDDMNVVFLQANDEVKRTLLPRNVHSMHQVKMSFVRTFPNVTRAFVEQPHVKIYIQEPSKGALFYELEDPGDIKNKSVLRLREKSTRVTSPIGYLDQPDYHSETEQDDGRRLIPMLRPASAMAAPTIDFLQQMQMQMQKTSSSGAPQKPSYHNDIYSDPYHSDTSSHDSRSVTRSGSATPVIDRESRARMETMERQLAGLSSLVHSALVSKGMSETTQRDMAELRREILSMHPDSARESSEEPPSSLSDSISSHTAYQLSVLRNKLKDTHHELRQLRTSAQVNAQTGNTLLREAGDKIGKIIADRMKGPQTADTRTPTATSQHQLSASEPDEDGPRNEHASRLAELLHSLTNFETNVETVRGSVLTNQKKLRMSEVEEMTEKLTMIGRLAADLKTDFPPIQMSLEQRIKRDMERVVREEKFIRDQNTAVDQSLRRCKALANIMVTMKKLAMVQDPTIQRSRKKTSELLPPKPSVGQAIGGVQSGGVQKPVIQHGPAYSQAGLMQQAQAPPPPPPSPPMPPTNIVKVAPMVEYSEPVKSPISELDGVLEEIGEPGAPPRPPSRYSVPDVRMKYPTPPPLPDQLRSLIEDVARRASPGPEPPIMQDRRQDLEERQERLAEKQRQLRSQFQQLQQLAPLP